MLRALVASLLLLAGFAALAPQASAVYICQSSTFLSDLDPDDDDPYIVDAHCSTENVSTYVCKVHVTVWDGGSVTRTTYCEPLVCTTTCCMEACPPPPTMASAQGPCVASPDAGAATVTVTCGTTGYHCTETVWVDPLGVHRTSLQCDPLIYCVMEPCPGGGPIRV
jgi:hypothetical protein